MSLFGFKNGCCDGQFLVSVRGVVETDFLRRADFSVGRLIL